ncbi:MAG: threonine/serine dehydratase [Chloroflexi bacterium]|nr:threonine/serine dehydratase [Chloroflexota bacterium]
MDEFNFCIEDIQNVHIWQARERIEKYIYHTPLVYSSALSQRTGGEVFLKMENWQKCGCFKVRGAINMVSVLTAEQRRKGLVTCSSGNHGTALAYAASLFGYPPTRIYLPKNAEPTKVNRIRSFGAEPVFHGEHFLDAYAEAISYYKKSGATYVHSHGDPLVIAGQGTIGIEIMEDLPDAEMIIVPVGGGGILAGIAMIAKSASPSIRIIGVESDAAPGGSISFRDGYCHEWVDIKPGIADGIMGTLTPLTYQITKDIVETIEVVSDTEIVEAMRTFQEDEQIIVEPAACVGLAAVLAGKINIKGKKAVFVLTGRNVNSRKFNELIAIGN